MLLLSKDSQSTSIVDAETGSALHDLKGHTGDNHCAQWSNDGRLIATGASDKTIRLWDTQTGKQVRVLAGHTDNVRAVAWSTNDELLASAGDTTIRVWNAKTGESVRILNNPVNVGVRSVAWSPDGKTLASGDGVGKLHLWDTTAGQRTDTFDGPPGGVESLAWSPDGKLIASGHESGTVCVRNPHSDKKSVLQGHSTAVLYIQWSRDGSLLFTSDWNGLARLWDSTSGHAMATLCFTEPLQRLFVSADGHCNNTPAVGRDLRYVVQTSTGQLTLAPDDFATEYGWKNDPERVRDAMASLSPPAPNEPAPRLSPGRRLAEFLLSLGGSAGVEVKDGAHLRTVYVRPGQSFPESDFKVNDIRFDTTELTDEKLGELIGLMPGAVTAGVNLNVKQTRVTDAGLVHLRGQRLGMLVLSGTNVSEQGLRHLSEIDGLTHLDLSGPSINDDSINHVARLKNLTSLAIEKASVTDDGLAQLSELKQLVGINLIGTKVSPQAWEQFVADHPRLQLIAIQDTGLGDEGLRIASELKQLEHLTLKQATSARVPVPSPLYSGERVRVRGLQSALEQNPSPRPSPLSTGEREQIVACLRPNGRWKLD